MRHFTHDLSLRDYFVASLTLASSWPAHFRLRLKLAIKANPLIRYFVSCRPRCSSAPLPTNGDSSFFDHARAPHNSTLPLWTVLSRPSCASHCFSTAQLICDSATTLVGNFSLQRAFQGEATVWPEDGCHTTNEINASQHVCLAVWTRIAPWPWLGDIASVGLSMKPSSGGEPKPRNGIFSPWSTVLFPCLPDCADWGSTFTLFWWRGFETVISLFAVDRRGCSTSDLLQKS